jgi:hypothetical protein
MYTCFSSLVKTAAAGSKKKAAQYKALMIVMNESGLVLNYCFTRSESLKECGPMLTALKTQCSDIQLIMTGKYIKY